MFSKTRQWQIGIAAFVFVISILLGYEDSDEETSVAKESLKMERGDYYLRDTRMIVTNSAGQPVYNMTASQMDYYAGDEHAELTNLTLDYFANQDTNQPDTSQRETNKQDVETQGEHWQFTAKRGFLPPGSTIVELSEAVTAKQIDTNQPTSRKEANLAGTMINTERLDIYLQDDIAVSPAAILQRGADYIDAKAVTINMQTSVTEINGGVRAEYQPK